MSYKAFFGSGYKEKEESDPVIVGVDPAMSDPVSDRGVCINVMGRIYEGDDKIEMISGNVVIDGTKFGELPITSGTWFKVLNGKIVQTENKTLTIIS